MGSLPLFSNTLAFFTSAKIPFLEPSSDEFDDVKVASIAGLTEPFDPPAVIARPVSAEQVATIVKHCTEQGLDFNVRAGGHDLFGRISIPNGILIDLRGVNDVKISTDRKTVSFGGGTLFKKLQSELEKENLMVPAGAVDTIGAVSWTTIGGYGPCAPLYGLGCDGLVAAKLVNASGTIFDADDALLSVLRGGGAGNWGVIVEMTIKTRPMANMQSGVMAFNTSAGFTEAAVSLLTSLRDLVYNPVNAAPPPPPQLYIQPCSMTVPGMGKALAVLITWTGEADALYEEWMGKLAAVEPGCVHQAMQTLTPAGTSANMSTMLPKTVYGWCDTRSMRALSTEAIATIAKVLDDMPAGDAMTSFWIHSMSSQSPSCRANGATKAPAEQGENSSVFRFREPHFMLEVVGCGTTVESGAAAVAWQKEAIKMLSGVDSVLEGTYLGLTAGNDFDLERIYTPKAIEEMRRLKKVHDPKGVFKFASPRGL